MKVINHIFLVFAMVLSAQSQGFNWQYSARLPYSLPDLFVGVTASAGLITNSGNFTFMEDHIPCCDYDAGGGANLKLGFATEYWHTGNLAFTGSASLIRSNSNFGKSITVPRSDGLIDYDAKYKYTMEESRYFAGLELTAKYRLSNSHFAVGGGFTADYLLSSSATHAEEILAPADETFIDGTKKRDITSGILSDYNKLMISPCVFVSFDQSLSIDYYSSIKIFTALPIMSVVEGEDWKEWKIGIGIQILKTYK